MSYLAILVVSFLASLSLGSPVARQTSVCPLNGIPSTTNFTLLAVSKADTTVKTPLALGYPAPLANVPVTFLGSAESIASDTIDSNVIAAQDFSMVDGGITAYAPNCGDPVFVSNTVEDTNAIVSFSPFNDGSPAEVYCESFNTDPYGVEYPYALTVNGGDGDNFSLCQSTTNDAFYVYYKTENLGFESENAGYIWSSCTAVYIYTIPVTQ